MKKKNNMWIGVVFIILGLVFLFNNLSLFNNYFNIINLASIISRFWPLIFMVLPGALFHFAFFTRKSADAGILLPGGVLVTAGVICQISALTDIWESLWPSLILSGAVGLFELYFFGVKNKRTLAAALILGGVSLLFFISTLLRYLLDLKLATLILPLGLIALGIIILIKNGSVIKRF